MAEYYTTLTYKGAEKVAAAFNGGPSLQLTQMAIGDGGGNNFYTQYDKEALKKRSTLVSQKWVDDLNLVDVDQQNPAWVITEGLIPTHVGGWYIREVGIFDTAGDLIAIGVYPETYKPVATAVEADLLVRSILEVGDADSVELKIDPSQVMATRAWVLEIAIPQAITMLDEKVDEAAEYAERAEDARDIAQYAVGIFASTTLGQEATLDTQHYWVPSENDIESVTLYRNDMGSAVPIKTYPSTEAIRLLNQRVDAVLTATSAPPVLGGEFHGANEHNYSYVMVDEEGRRLLAVGPKGFESFVGMPEAAIALERGNLALEQQSAPGQLPGEFHGTSEHNYSYVMVDEEGRRLLAVGPKGFESFVGMPEAANALERGNLALEQQSASGQLSGDFHGENDAHAYALLDESGQPLIAFDTHGHPITHWSSDFHTDGSSPSYAMVDEHGNPLLAWGEEGKLIDPWLADFHDDGHSPSYAMVDETGKALLAWDENGELQIEMPAPVIPQPEKEIALLPYLNGTELRAVGATDKLAAELGSYTALNIAPGSARHVRAVLDWPALSPIRSVAAANGWLIPDSDRVLHVMIGLGQSLMCGSTSSSSLVSIKPLWPDDVLMFDAGINSDVRMGIETQGDQQELDPDSLTGFLPLVAKVGQGSGNRGETPMEAMATTLAQQAKEIGAHFKSLSFTACQGGSSYSKIKKGSQVYANMLAALAKAAELAGAHGWKIIVDGCIVKHGESDAGNTGYANDLLEWQANVDTDVKAITGQQVDVHFVIPQPSSTGGGTSSIEAMLELHNTSPVHHLSGPDYPFGDTFHTDYLHFTGPGYHLIGEQAARAWKQALWSAEGKSQITQIVAAERSESTVTLTYEVPTPPLVFDTTMVTERDVKGFRYTDSNGGIDILSATITNDGISTGLATITLELASLPNGTGEQVLYALSPQSHPRSEQGIPRGNVRDSAPETSRYDGRRLYNWAVHQRFDSELNP